MERVGTAKAMAKVPVFVSASIKQMKEPRKTTLHRSCILKAFIPSLLLYFSQADS